MGYWGHKAWENDEAADWFDDLFEESKFREIVRRALERDVKEDLAEVRAAAFMLIQLGDSYIWPIDHLDDDNRLAVKQLKAARELIVSQLPDPELESYIKQIDLEIAVLGSRLEESQPDGS